MRYSEVYIDSVGYTLPDQALTSEDIENRLASVYQALNYEQGKLHGLTGIKERRVWPCGTLPSSIASQAAEKALAQASIKKDEIDVVIHTGVCRDALEPSTAHVVHANLGLGPQCLTFDIGNACLSFLNGLIVAANMLELGQIRSALVVTGENAGPLYEHTLNELVKNPSEELYRKSLANMTLGSAGLAFVLSKNHQGHKLLGGIYQTDSSGHGLCRGHGDIHQLRMETDTVELMRKGLILSHISWQFFKNELSWEDDTPEHILTHQISRSHQDKFFQLLKLDAKKGYSNIEWLGNTGSAAAPLSLAMASEEGLLKKGDRAALLGIGSGISTLMLGIKW